MKKTLEEYLIEAIAEKRLLVDKITAQMQGDVDDEVLSSLTIRQHHLSIDNLDAALINLKKGDYQQAIYFYGRGCSNMGEFKGRSDKERGKA